MSSIQRSLVKYWFTVASLGLFVVSCTDDKKTDEAVSPQASELPAVPPGHEAFTAEMVHFDFDSSNLSASAQDKLNALANHLKTAATSTVEVQGHCDARGTVEYNLALGERRAQAVKNYLVQLGVDGSRVSTVSFGKEKPLVQGHSEESWAKNRRAEFVLSGN